MANTIYATFADPDDAERAAGALLDHGVKPEDISMVRNGSEEKASTEPRTVASNVVIDPNPEAPAGSVYGVERSSEEGERTEEETVRTEHDVNEEVKSNAIKGSLVGVGVGALAAVASLIIPGVGLVFGAGALASALGGMVATAGAGAAAGAIVGYMKEAGMEEAVADEFGDAVEEGGAILAVAVPSGSVGEEEARAVLNRYQARNVHSYASRNETYLA